MAAARAFARQLPGKDRVGVITFADRPELVQDLTAIREFILRAIGNYQATGGTALYDAVFASLERLKKAEGRTAIVVLTDGRDENNPGTGPGSVHTLDEVLAMVARGGDHGLCDWPRRQGRSRRRCSGWRTSRKARRTFPLTRVTLGA